MVIYMKKMICKITAVLTVFVLMLSLFAMNISAVSGSTSIAVSNGSPKVGSTLIVTVTANVDADAVVQGQLKYDSSKLKFLTASPAGNANKSSDGTVEFLGDDFLKSHSFRVEFEVIAEGNASLSTVNCVASDENSEVNISGTSKTVKAGNVQTTSSQDTTKNLGAALTSIGTSAGTLSPKFKANVTEYTVVVPYSHTDGALTCETLDPKAKTVVEGSRDLKVGLNKRTIIVTASNGEVRRYTVTFNRLDENGKDTTQPVEEPILATVNGKEFEVSQSLEEGVTIPAGFTLSSAKYNEEEIAVYIDASGKTAIAYLIAVDQSEKGFFVFENNSFSPFDYIQMGDKVYIVKDGKPAPDGFYKSEYEFGETKVPCYKYTGTEFADYVIFFVQTMDGKEGYYRLDTLENTLQRYLEFEKSEPVNTQPSSNIPKAKLITVIVLGTLFVLSVLAIIVLVIIKVVIKAKNRKIEEEYFANEEDNF